MILLSLFRWGLWLFFGCLIFYKLYRVGTDQDYRKYIENKYTGSSGLIVDVEEDVREDKSNKVLVLVVVFAMLAELLLSINWA